MRLYKTKKGHIPARIALYLLELILVTILLFGSVKVVLKIEFPNELGKLFFKTT